MAKTICGTKKQRMNKKFKDIGNKLNEIKECIKKIKKN